VIRREAKTMVPEIEQEVTGLGRFFGGSSVAMPAAPAKEPEGHTKQPA
jgi:hypothetical protein